jgi:hypothetical protein
VVVGDRDGHGRGQDGAHSLARDLALFCRQVRVVLPPAGIKDARAWLNAGATRDDVIAAVRAAQPVRLVVTTARPARAGGRGRGR